MQYSDFKGERLSKLGFGAMRLPLLADGYTIDEPRLAGMLDYAMSHGINYYDTAYPYHDGLSETVLCRLLKKYPRSSYFLADKYPGHQLNDTYNPAGVFEHQLRKCGVDYFDFYLMHNVYENSIEVYLDPAWGIMDYFVEQRRLGRIRHLGFSAHGGLDTLRRFLDSPWGEQVEFCQIQLNYVDWTLQHAAEKCRLLAGRGLPVWVMEPVRGGRLAALDDAARFRLQTLRPDASAASWAFRWLQTVTPDVKVVLSGMSSLEQMQDNVQTFADDVPLSSQELSELERVAASLCDMVPCTACRYCCDSCSQGLDIPAMMAALNDLRVDASFTAPMYVESLPEDKRPSACLGCGACAAMCPQQIDIPSMMEELVRRLDAMPKWSDICRIRNEIARKQAGDGYRVSPSGSAAPTQP
ncbi:MAG: aldo/keto reductase [Bacteroidales bacterium]|nr:aldo/keto reductase [Bacteroidales bacterium]